MIRLPLDNNIYLVDQIVSFFGSKRRNFNKNIFFVVHCYGSSLTYSLLIQKKLAIKAQIEFLSHILSLMASTSTLQLYFNYYIWMTAKLPRQDNGRSPQGILTELFLCIFETFRQIYLHLRINIINVKIACISLRIF